MRVLLDSDLIVAALWAEHPRHSAAIKWLVRAKDGDAEAFLSQHGIAEVFVGLTNAPVLPRFHPHSVRTALGELLWHVQLAPLDEADYLQALEHAADFEVGGDGFSRLLHLRAAVKSEVESLVTLDPVQYQSAEGVPGPLPEILGA